MSLFCFEHKILLSEHASLFVWKTPCISEDVLSPCGSFRSLNSMTLSLGKPIHKHTPVSQFLKTVNVSGDMKEVNSSVR